MSKQKREREDVGFRTELRPVACKRRATRAVHERQSQSNASPPPNERTASKRRERGGSDFFAYLALQVDANDIRRTLAAAVDTPRSDM